MKTLYDLLDVRADDDVETLKKAFRKAVKATHPDLHAGDPDAPLRFRLVVAANAILRDAERRVTYDRLLQLERQQRRSKRTRAIISHTVAVAVVCVALTFGYELFAPIFTTAIVAVKNVKDTARATEPVKVVKVAATAVPAVKGIKGTATAIPAVKADMDDAGGPAETAAVQPAARPTTTGQDGPHDKHEAAEVPNTAIEASVAAPATNSDALVVADRGPAQGLPSNDAKFYREHGIASYRSGDFPRAIIDFDEAIRLDPNDAQAYNIRGNSWDEIGAFDRALADYEQAIRIDPNNPAVFHDRAILWRRRGALDKALVDLDRAIRFSFSDANVYSDRGLVWYEKGRYDRAIADFNQAIKIDPNFAGSYINRGVILHRKIEFNLALAAVNQAVRVDPSIFNVIRRMNLRP